MRLYFHHVGQNGANEDFPKTVFKKVPMDLIRDNIQENTLEKEEIVEELEKLFPNGLMNCWGVPRGANYIIRHLEKNDPVLLVESCRIDGVVPALCMVKAYWPIEMRELSYSLWGDDKYPYIFYFNTEFIDLTWVEFLEHMNYKENYNPSGMFMRVNPGRLGQFGGVKEYIEFLRKDFSPTKE